MATKYILRHEKELDYMQVDTLTREAFWNKYRPGCSEHYILNRFRDLPEFVKELDYVITADDKIVAHIMYAKAEIECDNGNCVPVLTFGPVSVLPSEQGKGLGSQIIRYTLAEAQRIGYGAVAITGNPKFYNRFGFKSGSSQKIYFEGMSREEEAPFFMVKELMKGYLDSVEGTFIEPKGYYASQEEVEEFDKNFPHKEKLKLDGQLDK